MTAALALVGWATAAATFAFALVVRQGLSRRMELVARACHELRGPLTAARLGLHLTARVEGAGAEPLAVVDAELERAALALDDLSAARDGDRAADRAEAVDVAELLRSATEASRPLARARGVAVRLDGSPRGARVRGDRRRLAQACGNLIANALEHGAGPVRVRGRTTRGRVRIEVSDGGPGLPAPVAQLARRPRAGRGTRGRGLAIAAEIAARHGGRLASAPSTGGARLALELPLQEGSP